MKRKHGPTPLAERVATLRRDNYACVAPRITPDCDPCEGPLEVDHVRPEVGSITVSEARWMQVLCRHHHQHGWATSHRPESRLYLARTALRA